MPLIWLLLTGMAGVGLVMLLVRAMTEGIQVAILGMRGAGKTTLIRQLSGQGYDPNEPATSYTHNYNRIEVSRNGAKFVLHHIADLSGGRTGKEAWAEWEKNTKHKDLVFYLVNAEVLRMSARQRLTSKDWHRVVRDIEQLVTWREEADLANPFYALIVTHRDLDPRFAASAAAEYQDQLKQDLAPLLDLLSRERSEVYSINLTDADEVKELVVQIGRRWLARK